MRLRRRTLQLFAALFAALASLRADARTMHGRRRPGRYPTAWPPEWEAKTSRCHLSPPSPASKVLRRRWRAIGPFLTPRSRLRANRCEAWATWRARSDPRWPARSWSRYAKKPKPKGHPPTGSRSCDSRPLARDCSPDAVRHGPRGGSVKSPRTRQRPSRSRPDRKAVNGVSDPKEFERLAKQVDAEGLEVRVEQLLPVAADGRVADPTQPPGGEPIPLDEVFARRRRPFPPWVSRAR